MTPDTTYVSILTPPGTAAIATVVLVGPRAWTVAAELFRPSAVSPPVPDPPPLDRFWHGQFGGPTGDAVVLTVKSFQPIPCVEVHCHGGPAVIRWLTATLLKHGLSLCAWPESLKRSGVSPLSALAAAELARATTQRTASILLDQWHGAFERAVIQISQLLDAGNRSAALHRLSALRRHTSLGRHLTRPWRAAVAGAPNVGKSTLVNALAGFQRSVVTAMPGTTRDVVTTVLAIDGWPVELIDTAGQHGTPDTLEQEGIARARAAAAAADLCLWVVAADTVPVWPDSGSSNVILVVNKIDLAPTWDTEAVKDAIPVSAQIGAELDTLCERVSLKLVSDPPAAGTGVPFAPVLSSGVEAVTDALLEGKTEIARTGLHALTRPSE